MLYGNYEAVIGLEVHAQLSTRTKIFCGCSTDFGNEPNSNVCPVCLGHPGVLPVLNKRAVEYAVKMGLAVNCHIAEKSVFARKNYFYPDLPKGYQISQYDEPLCTGGYIKVYPQSGEEKTIGITRIHLEEDAGKSIHDRGSATLVDLNRTGVPLIEIVSEPDIRTAEEAVLYLSAIRQIVQYLGICDGNMEEGSLRCDANISVRQKGETKLGTKTEVKNMNSFRSVERAIEYEIARQIDLLEDGKEIIQQTLLWNADTNTAHPMRTKEDSHDYRYFPDPDLIPVVLSEEYINEVRSNLPELPEKRRERFMEEYQIPAYDAGVLTQSKSIADYFEQVTARTKEYKLASNWVMVDLMKVLNERKAGAEESPVSSQSLADLINEIGKGTISSKIAKEVFADMVETGKEPLAIIKEKNLIQVSDPEEIKKIIRSVIEAAPSQAEEYRSGKEKVFGYFVGQVMKQSKGKANPAMVNELLKEMLLNG
ncbi:MAG: Asp-tRNA(Asn)/Glu-tRNA(Gln) amidotransferase subunit GatB [Ignavibacteriales bacterium]|nr:MAG: Asp-tRNA(Asn)/Glu-tRNA(Gln) amidotransferase subunit GatB [Ignavibacteriales bacterium]